MKATDKGIFLQRTAFSDSSLIVTFLTEKGGLQKFVFRGGKKKAHSLFPLSIAELTYYGRADSELLNLVSAEGSKAMHFPFHPVKSTIAFFMAETLRKCVAPSHIDHDFFTFAESWIEELNTSQELLYFPLEFLIACSDALGFRPLIEEENASFFNLDAGVFQASPSVIERTEGGEAAHLIKQILEYDTSPQLSKAHREQALEIMLRYFAIHVPRFGQLDSYEIVKEILRA